MDSNAICQLASTLIIFNDRVLLHDLSALRRAKRSHCYKQGLPLLDEWAGVHIADERTRKYVIALLKQASFLDNLARTMSALMVLNLSRKHLTLCHLTGLVYDKSREQKGQVMTFMDTAFLPFVQAFQTSLDSLPPNVKNSILKAAAPSRKRRNRSGRSESAKKRKEGQATPGGRGASIVQQKESSTTDVVAQLQGPGEKTSQATGSDQIDTMNSNAIPVVVTDSASTTSTSATAISSLHATVSHDIAPA